MGIGRDGAQCAKAFSRRGMALGLAQSPDTCVVAGMPQSLLALGLSGVEAAPPENLGRAGDRIASAGCSDGAEPTMLALYLTDLTPVAPFLYRKG